MKIKDVRIKLLTIPFVEQPALQAGYSRDRDGGLLADNTLGWMMKEVRGVGLSLESHLGRTLQPGALAKVHRSRRSFYRLKTPLYQPIDHGKDQILIHRSVKERWESSAKYRPKNLVAYVEGDEKNEAKGWGTLVS